MHAELAQNRADLTYANKNLPGEDPRTPLLLTLFLTVLNFNKAQATPLRALDPLALILDISSFIRQTSIIAIETLNILNKHNETYVCQNDCTCACHKLFFM